MIEPAAALAPEPCLERPAADRRALGLAVTAAAGGVLLFFSPALAGGQFIAGDTGRLHLPVKRWIAERLSRGELPLWNPFLGLGMPLVPGGADAPLHPFNLLLVALPFEWGFKLWALASLLLAALGGVVWARQLGAGAAAAAACGLAFTLSGAVVGYTENYTYLTALASLPLLLAAGLAFAARGGAWRLLGVGGAAALTAAAGDPQGFVFTLALFPAQALWQAGSTAGPGRRLARAAGAVAFALAASAAWLAPSIAWLPHSDRALPLRAVDLAVWSLRPERLAEFVVPHLWRGTPGAVRWIVHADLFGDGYTARPWLSSIYLGATALFLAVAAARTRPAARWLLAAAGAFAWASLGPHGGFQELARHLPVVGEFRYWEKLAVFPALLVAGAAGLGIDLAVRGEGPRLGFVAGALGAIGLALAGAVRLGSADVAALLGDTPARLEAARLLADNAVDGLLHTGATLLALGGALLLARRGPFRRLGPALLALVVTLDVAGSASRDWKVGPGWLSPPPTPLATAVREHAGLRRVVVPFWDYAPALTGRGLTEEEGRYLWYARSLHAATNVAWHVGNFRNYTALHPVRAAELEQRLSQAEWLGRAGLWGVQHAVVPVAPEKAAERGLPPPYEVEARDPEAGLFLLALPHRPRAYLAREVVGLDRAGALAFALSEDPRSPRTAIEGPVPAGFRAPQGTVTVARDEPERLELHVETDRTALLVLNDAHAAGWTADIDGTALPILPANFTVRGAWVPAGAHAVTFVYRMPGLLAGLLLSGMVFVGAIGLAVWEGARRHV